MWEVIVRRDSPTIPANGFEWQSTILVAVSNIVASGTDYRKALGCSEKHQSVTFLLSLWCGSVSVATRFVCDLGIKMRPRGFCFEKGRSCRTFSAPSQKSGRCAGQAQERR